MGSQEKPIDSPFHAEPVLFHWIPGVANFVLAAGCLLFLGYVAMQLRNLSVAVSDKTTAARLTARVKTLEKQAGTSAAQAGEAKELKDLIAHYFDTQKAKEEANSKLAAAEKNLDRSLASLKAGGKGRKKKQVDAELKRVKAEGERQIASAKERSAKASAENKKVYEQLKDRVKAQNPTPAPSVKWGKGK